MRYYRVEVVFDDGSTLWHDVFAENALCAILKVGQKNTDHEPLSVFVKELA